MSQSVFADTWYYVAALCETDPFHSAVVAWSRTYHRPVVTTAWVVAEVLNAMSAPHRRLAAHRTITELYTAEGVTVIPADTRWLTRGLALYGARPDKNWSLTDCISFEVMAEFGLTDALTGDRHFAQAGFHALFADDTPT